MVTVFCISHIPALLNLRTPGLGGRGVLLFVLRIVLLVLVVQGGDLVQHLWIRCLGRHPLTPQILAVGDTGALIKTNDQ
ncbi:MAG: hypothetical protein ACK59Y_13645 [Betaproteobacteria bacterium]|jgi:phosphatidate cytidylyltransferase|nr:hypothetical protein [Betaproteobacteria bacterium]